ncbi:MAG: hypothetical protein IRZ11_07920 [Clostridia bacterium]|nr:hypothetical protein [Clostridia bacterium]
MSRQVTDLAQYRRERDRRRRDEERRLQRFRRIDVRARREARAAARGPGRFAWARGLRWWVVILVALLLLNAIRLALSSAP